MNNTMGIARTNYFQVKNVDAFRLDMNDFNVQVVEEPIQGIVHFALFDTADGGAWPIDKEGMGGKLIPACFYDTVASHLTDDSIAVFMGISYDSSRTIRGHAIGIDSAGNRTKIELDDIYHQVKAKWNKDVEKVQY